MCAAPGCPQCSPITPLYPLGLSLGSYARTLSGAHLSQPSLQLGGVCLKAVTDLLDPSFCQPTITTCISIYKHCPHHVQGILTPF